MGNVFLGNYLEAIKRQGSKGRCLHFDTGERCKEIISAHSIQRMGQLQHIAEDGHVYRMNGDISTLRKTNGTPVPKRIGIGKASTFLGFCKVHDNALFEPIDNFPLRPTAEQIALYAHRSLCRECFVKENAMQVLKETIASSNLDDSIREFMSAMLHGTALGVKGLQYHKNYYDGALRNESFDEFRYISFFSESRCSLQLSGLLYPEFDYLGRTLNDLSDWSSPPGLLTAFTAPTDTGWSFTFAWHSSSDSTCVPFIQSLIECVARGDKLEDLLLRFSISTCENHAIRISWWDGLPESGKQALLGKFRLMLEPGESVPNDYLMKGCEGLADWIFGPVFTNLEVGPSGG
ncbi:hypothetical protein [Pseudomonas bubulae]|uniref:hypothetical protein n=1 Tax=Pseudomonas bubulae TaxID=2316085 RepID=UPI001F48B3CE|nr:hypothetical protein [Pseudomonas bubulae]MCF3194863.1 hypothetical protein [Pseudomonas bubulae]